MDLVKGESFLNQSKLLFELVDFPGGDHCFALSSFSSTFLRPPILGLDLSECGFELAPIQFSFH